MFSATLAEFLVSGTLGRLRLGLSPTEVESLCGPADDTSTPSFPRIWKYGDLQIAFLRDDRISSDERVNFLGLYLRGHSLAAPRALNLLGWWPDPGTTLAAFTDYLDQHDILWSIDPALTFEDQTTLRIGIGVSATFSHVNLMLVLESLQLLARADSGAANTALNPTGNKPAS
jgi:hypothetical protein